MSIGPLVSIKYSSSQKKVPISFTLGCGAFALGPLSGVFVLHLLSALCEFLSLLVYRALKEGWALTNKSTKQRIQRHDGLQYVSG